jgi:hypothetical protein
MTPFPPTWIPFRANLWLAARLLPFFAKRRPLDSLLAMATPPQSAAMTSPPSVSAIVEAIKAAVARPLRMRGRRCLREGLLAFHYLSLCGYRPILHFGLERDSLNRSRRSAHSWVTVKGETVLNPPSESLIKLFSYDGTKPIAAKQLSFEQIADSA